MSQLDKPEIEEVINRAITNLEETIGTKLNADQKALFIVGYSSGLTTLKNFPEHAEGLVYDLWAKCRSSKDLNQKVKNWADSLIK